MAKPPSKSSKQDPKKQESKKRTHKPTAGKQTVKPRAENPDQQGERANIRQNQRNIDRRTMR